MGGKKKREGQKRKKKREEQIAIEVHIVLAGIGLTELRVKRPREVVIGVGKLKKVVMGAKRLEKAAMAGARGLVSLSLPGFLLLSTFSSFMQVYFLPFDKCF